MTSLLINANALHIPLADKSVNCVVTSPPYYGTTAILWYNECMNNNKEIRADANNLVLLCVKCHRFVHSKKNINGEFIGKEVQE